MKLFSISDRVQYVGKQYTVANITQHGVSLEVVGKGTKKAPSRITIPLAEFDEKLKARKIRILEKEE
tara:strand:+ start:2859 stop:3059 length:201 start_codon:yes stop_codon:yes gene_type:complete